MQAKIKEFYQKLKDAADVPQPVFGVIENLLASILNEAIDNNIPYFADLLQQDLKNGYGKWIETVKDRIEADRKICSRAIAEEMLVRIRGEAWLPVGAYDTLVQRLRKESPQLYAGDMLAVVYQTIRGEMPHDIMVEALNRKHFAGISEKTGEILHKEGQLEILKDLHIAGKDILKTDLTDLAVRTDSVAVHRTALEACITEYQRAVLSCRESNRNKRDVIVSGLMIDLFEAMAKIIRETIPDDFAASKWEVRMHSLLEEKRGSVLKPADLFRLSHGQYLYIRCGESSFTETEFLEGYEEMILMTELAADNESVHPETWRHSAKSKNYLNHYLAARSRLHELISGKKQDS